MPVLEFKDFSGGITEKNIPGATNRYTVAKNLLIDIDRKLYQRDGIDIFSSTAYQMPAAERVAALVNFDNSSELLAVHNKKVEYISAGAWTEATGPSGNHAFNTDTAASLISQAQWNHHLYLASDSGDPLVKLYRDDGGVMRMRTAGLPEPAVSDVYATDAAKLAAAIALAQDIKTQLQAHVNDYGVSPAAHLAKHTAVYNALNALTTPVTLSDLIAYTKTLRSNLDTHIADAKNPGLLQSYHIQESGEYSVGGWGLDRVKHPILNIKSDIHLPADAAITTLAQVVNILNDLRNKYSWHVLAPATHNNAKVGGASWGAHFLTVSKVDLEAKYPTVTPNISTLLRYVNYLKQEYNLHANDAGTAFGYGNFYAHRTADSRNLIEMPDATDLVTAVAMLALLEFNYAQHYEDANLKTVSTFYESTGSYEVYKGTVTSGSAVIASVTPDPTAALVGITGDRMARQAPTAGSGPYAWFSSNSPFAVSDTVSSVTSTSITMSANSALSGDYVFAFAKGILHFDIDRAAAAKTSSGYAAKNFYEQVDLSLADLASVTDFAKAFSTKLKAHTLSGAQAMSTSELLLDSPLWGTANTANFSYYNFPTSGTAPWTGNDYVPHRFNSFSYWPVGAFTYLVNESDYGQGFFEAGMEVASYNYRLTYSYDYKVGSASFTDVSSPSDILNISTVISPVDLSAGDTGVARDAIAFSSLPAITNASNQNYDTGNIKLQIFRTVQNSSAGYYKVGEVTNGTTTFSDTVLDSQLVLNEALYTNGGVIPNGAPPSGATLIHQTDGRMYYVVGRKIYVSLPDDPDSVPDDFFDELPESCTGVSSTRGNVVAFTINNVYRMEGFFNELGQGFLRHESIFDRTGCIAPTSIVQADNGVFFAGKDGFYYTDGIQCFRASGDLTATFKALTATSAMQSRMSGVYDSVNKRIYWAVQSNTGSSSADLIWVMDLQFGIQANATPITTFSMEDAFKPTALAMYQDILHIGDLDGYVLKQVAGRNLDVKKDTSVVATSWNARTIMWDFKSCHGDFGSPVERKYFTRVLSEWEQSTNLSVQIVSDADKGRIVSNLPIIRSRKLTDWGDSKLDWISSVYTAKPGLVIDEFRRFKGDGSLRSNYRAIEFKNAYCVIVNSTDMGLVNVSNISTHVWALTLVNSATRKWPLYSVDYFVRIAGVDYPVVLRSSDSVIRVDDTGLTPLTVQTGISWELWGYPKNEHARLIQFSVDFNVLAGENQKAYNGPTSTDGGENA